MGSAITIFKMLAPLVWLPTAGLCYWHLNINQRVFVVRLGCGCSEGFNTNDLTCCFCFAAMAATGLGAWLASRSLGLRWRTAYLVLTAALLWEFLTHFMDTNLWL